MPQSTATSATRIPPSPRSPRRFAITGGALAAIFCVALGACETVRNARHAQDPASDLPGERTPTADELDISTTGTLRLDDAVATALRVHPSILQARRFADGAEARVGEVEGNFLPSASADASVVYRDQKGGTLSNHRFESLGFQMSWLLFDFGRTPALAREAALQWFAAQADVKNAEVEVAFAVRAAYYALVKQIGLRDVARETVQQFQEHLDQVRGFVEVGTRIPYDQTKAEVDLGNAQLDLVKAEDLLLADQAILANAMGLAEITDWAPEMDAVLPEPPATFDECWEQAQRDRPSLAAANAREAAASKLVDAQVDSLYPSLSLGGAFNAAGTSTPLPWSWQLGPILSWTPFDGFRNLYTIDEAVAALRSARAQRAFVAQQAWLEARGAWVALADARQRIELSALVVTNAEQNLTLAQGRFDAGKGTSIELTDAQQALSQARADAIQARADRDLATARLWKALGAITFEPAVESNP